MICWVISFTSREGISSTSFSSIIKSSSEFICGEFTELMAKFLDMRLIHMRVQVSIEITRVSKADEFCGVFRGAHVHVIIFSQRERRLTVHADDRVVTLDDDADG